MQVVLDGNYRVTPLVQTPFVELNGIISADGRWLAYEANNSGKFEVYGRPFPDVNSGHCQVSTESVRPRRALPSRGCASMSPTPPEAAAAR